VNWVDFVMIGFLLAFLIYGISRGFIRQILGIAAIVLGLVLAARFGPSLAESRFFDDLRQHNPNLPGMISYIAIFLLTTVAAGIIIALLTPRREPHRELRAVDSFLGAVLGALQGVLILGGLSIGLLEWKDPRAEPVQRSVLAPRLAEGCRDLVRLIPEKVRGEIKESYERGKEEVEKSLPPAPAGQPAPSGQPAPPAKESRLPSTLPPPQRLPQPQSAASPERG
jgi:membrane protein required for colicin V production